MILWGRASSVNVQKALWALDEYGLDYRHETVGGRHGGLDAPAFARLTPARRVPVLEVDGVGVWESHAILRRLARMRPDHPLSGCADQADPWMEFGTSTIQPPFIGLFWQLVRTRPEERSLSAVESLKEQLAQALDVIETGLSDGRPWLAGDGATLADIAVGTPFHRLTDIAGELVEPRPRVAAWVARMAARPGWIAHVATSYDELRPA